MKQKKSRCFCIGMPVEERHKKLATMQDEDIDFSDIPEIDETILEQCSLVKNHSATELISIRIESLLLKKIKALAKSQSCEKYQTLITAVLTAYVRHCENQKRAK